jgi:hypothetical protein
LCELRSEPRHDQPPPLPGPLPAMHGSQFELPALGKSAPGAGTRGGSADIQPAALDKWQTCCSANDSRLWPVSGVRAVGEAITTSHKSQIEYPDDLIAVHDLFH